MAKRITLLSIVSSIIMYFVFKTLGYQEASYIIRATILPLVLYLYYQRNVKDRRFYFFLFLLLFSISEITNSITNLFTVPFLPFLNNVFYLGAILSLVIDISININRKELIKKFYSYIIVLSLVCALYLYMISKTLTYSISWLEFCTTMLNSAMLFFIVSVSLINYCYLLTCKTLFLLIGVTAFLFSEVFKVAYMNINGALTYNLISSLLLIFTFYFLLKDKQEEEVFRFTDF